MDHELNDLFKNLKITTTKLPAFLKIFIHNNDQDITLVSEMNYLKKTDQCSDDTTCCMDDDTISPELDLTGNPLEISLGDGGNDTLNATSVLENPFFRSSDEAKYHPIPLKEARTFINKYLRLRSLLPVYVMCDGEDSQQTVILGAEQTKKELIRVLVHILGCCDENDQLMQLEFMRKDHLRSIGALTKVNYLNTKLYNIFGYYIKNNALLDCVENNGSIRLEVTNTENNQSELNIKILLQVITGHNNSLLHSFWVDLYYIQTLINILFNTETQNNPETIISSNNSLDSNEIINEIHGLLNTVRYMKKHNYKTLDFENLRQETVLDKLWEIMKQCLDLSDLRDCFHTLFEELAEGESKIQVTEDETSIFSVIINGILKGNLAISAVSFSQSLELLIELGLEKLKNDYATIINNFYIAAKEKLIKRWSELNSNVLSQSNRRKTRFSINPKCPITDLAKIKMKLLHLNQLHVIAEFMVLTQQYLSLSEENFYNFCENVFNNFVARTDLNVVRKLQLYEFAFALNYANTEIIPSTSPVCWSMEMNSVLNYSEVTTIFHYSQYPIIPNVVYIYSNADDTDVALLCDTEAKTQQFYVTKFVKYADYI